MAKHKILNFAVIANMGILGLSKLIADVAPSSIKENEMKNYFGRKVAIDASMSLYQVNSRLQFDKGRSW